MLKDIKAVIFDFDGTLYDFKGLPRNLIFSSLPNIFRINAVQKTRKVFKGKEFDSEAQYKNQFFGLLAKNAGFSNIAKAENWYKNLYMKKMISVLEKKYTKRDSAEDLFKTLKSNKIKIAIYSDYGMLKERLLAIGFSEDFLHQYVDFMISSEEFGCLKPAKKGFLEVASKLDTLPTNCLVVGDRVDTDGIGAFASGMKYFQIKTHKTKTRENVSHPIFDFADFSKFVKEN